MPVSGELAFCGEIRGEAPQGFCLPRLLRQDQPCSGKGGNSGIFFETKKYFLKVSLLPNDLQSKEIMKKNWPVEVSWGQIKRQRDEQTNRQTDKQTTRQTDNKTERQTDKHEWFEPQRAPVGGNPVHLSLTTPKRRTQRLYIYYPGSGFLTLQISKKSVHLGLTLKTVT